MAATIQRSGDVILQLSVFCIFDTSFCNVAMCCSKSSTYVPWPLQDIASAALSTSGYSAITRNIMPNVAFRRTDSADADQVPPAWTL